MSTRIADRYEPLEIVGCGGQGEVVRARDTRHDRIVALKVRRIRSEEDRREVLREARALLRIDPHPRVAIAREDFFDDDRYVIVIDWIEGRSLARVLAEDGPHGLPLERVVPWLQDAAAALDHLHALDPPLVHGDVKPANLVLREDGRVVLVDFGIAGDPGEDAGWHTPGFRAPELAAGGTRRPASDRYALAATAFTLLTGSPPSAGRAPDWHELFGVRAATIERALRRGLAYDPERRPDSAQALVEALVPTRIADRLPAPLTRFVGREREAGLVHEALRGSRLVTLTGIGGIGKTRLAIEVATDARALAADGSIFVDLAGVDDDRLVLPALAQALRLRDHGPRPLVDAVIDALRERQALVLVDTCERVLDGVAELVSSILPRCPHVRVLATSREALDVQGELVWAVPPLSVPSADAADRRSDALALFFERAHLDADERSRSEIELAGDIVRTLEGIPLAIELAAARTRERTLVEVRDELTDRLQVLVRGNRGAAERHRTLRSTLAWSEETLRPGARILLRRLGVFSGIIDPVRVAEVVADAQLPREAIADALDELHAKSLLTREATGDGRYRILDTVREYAVERLEEASEREQIEGRHVEAYCRLARGHRSINPGVSRNAWVQIVERDEANLRLALQRAFAEGDPDARLTLSSALAPHRAWHGRLEEAADRLRRALEAGGSELERAFAYAELGTIDWLRRDLAAAECALEAAAASAERAGDPSLELAILGTRANVAFARGDGAEARALLEQVIGRARSSGDPGRLASALVNLATVRRRSGEVEAAVDNLREALHVASVNGDDYVAAFAEQNLGNLALAAGDVAAARAHHAEALRRRRSIGHEPGIVTSLTILAETETVAGHADVARRLLEEALALSARHDDVATRAVCLRHLGTLALLEGDHAAARGSIEEALRLDRVLGDPYRLGQDLCALGDVARDAGRWEDARARYVEALESYARSAAADGIGAAETRLGSLALREGNLTRAAGWYLRAHGSLSGDPAVHGATAGLAAVCAAAGRADWCAVLAAATDPAVAAIDPDPVVDGWIALARAELGESAFAAGGTSGTRDEAVAFLRGLAS